ncbi:MAG: FHA domain-containing protein FhaB/FipA [Egibacteraceae bacterium]
MPSIVLHLLQALFLLLLYVFVARAVRAVVRDLRTASGPARAAAPRTAPISVARERARRAPGELVVHIPDSRPQVIRLNGDSEVTFGRAVESTVLLTDPYVSDHHAHVFHDGRGWLVEDLGSTNGTFLNQVKVTSPTPIEPGDQLGIGKTSIEVRK